MSFFNIFSGAPKKEAPADEEKGGGSGETMGIAKENSDMNYSVDASTGVLLNEEEAKEIREQNKYGREQA